MPYGTADNTYSYSDQYVATLSTVDEVPVNTLTFPVQNPLLNNTTVTLVVRAVVYSENGTPTNIFPAGTTIVDTDPDLQTITVSSPTRGTMPAGTSIEVSYDFDSLITQQMDYRGDCDPAYQFIKRSTPRSFGYLNGYLTGDGTAPNGEPFTSGTQFPSGAQVGEYFLRIDYLPQQLFRWDGAVWVMISQNIRTDTGFGAEDKSLLSGFINDVEERTPVSYGGTVPTRQSLSQALKIKPD